MRQSDAQAEIFVMNADGTNQVQLTNNTTEDSFPTWSPDGTQIAFQSNRDQGRSSIFKMQANGANPVRLTTPELRDVEPDWSPDGSRIAFARGKHETANFVICTMNPNGTDIRELTANPTGGLPTSFSSLAPQWSPSGKEIAFSSNRNTAAFPNAGFDDEIYTMKADGSNQTRRTNNTARDFHPHWSPGGTQIAFDSDRDQNNVEIYTMKADGSNQTRLTNNAGIDRFPDWTSG